VVQLTDLRPEKRLRGQLGVPLALPRRWLRLWQFVLGQAGAQELLQLDEARPPAGVLLKRTIARRPWCHDKTIIAIVPQLSNSGLACRNHNFDKF